MHVGSHSMQFRALCKLRIYRCMALLSDWEQVKKAMGVMPLTGMHHAVQWPS